MTSSSVRMSPTWLSLAPLLLLFAYACNSSEADAPELLPNQAGGHDAKQVPDLRGSLATRRL